MDDMQYDERTIMLMYKLSRLLRVYYGISVRLSDSNALKTLLDKAQPLKNASIQDICFELEELLQEQNQEKSTVRKTIAKSSPEKESKAKHKIIHYRGRVIQKEVD